MRDEPRKDRGRDDKVASFNALSLAEAKNLLFQCCPSKLWALQMAANRPFAHWEELVEKGRVTWANLKDPEKRAVFDHHPRIGTKKIPSSPTAHLSQEEQSSVAGGPQSVLKDFKILSEEYEKIFGFIFLVSAHGKSALELLEILTNRMKNTPEVEFQVAMSEQGKITLLRLEKLFSGS